MHKIVDIALEADMLRANRELADENHELLRKHGIRSFDFLGSIGSGKTLLIEKIIERLMAGGKRPAVIAGDVSGNDDYMRFLSHGVQAVNLNTGKECHLDAHLTDHALENMDLENTDVLFVENVGNLVCPADFPLGTDMRIVVISVTEGDDMVRKHPIMFGGVDLIVINKVDLSEAIEVDPQILVNDARRINPGAAVVLTDAKHENGVEELMEKMGL